MKKIIVLVLVIIISSIAVYGGCVLYERSAYPLRYTEYIKASCDDHSVSAPLIAGLINTESSFNERAVSTAGAIGLMQLRPSTAYWLAEKLGITNLNQDDLFDPETNIRLGTYYMSYLQAKFGETTTALAAYNAGEGNVRTWLSDKTYSTDGTTLTSIPYKETREHVQKVIKAQKKYQKRAELINRD